MRNRWILAACATSVVALTACGGSGGNGGTEGNPPDASTVTFTEQLASFQTIDGLWDGETETSPQDLPTTGSSTYDGFLTFDVNTQCNTDRCQSGEVTPTFALAGKTMVGEISLAVDFEEQSINGTVGSLIDQTNDIYTVQTGGLVVAGGGGTDINNQSNDDPAFNNVSANGTLTSPDDTEYTANLGLEGDFRGGSGGLPTFVGGGVTGSLMTGGGSEEAGEVGGLQNGEFVAQR